MGEIAGSETETEFQVSPDNDFLDQIDEDGCGFDCGGESPRTHVEDVEGFPSFQLLESEVDGGGSVEEEDGDGDGDDAGEGESFSSSFYNSGTDWSCLRVECAEEDEQVGENVRPVVASADRKLKQASLLQVWGLKRKEVDVVAASTSTEKKKKVKSLRERLMGTDSSKSNPMFMNKKKKFGVAETRVRACPFYKKLPGTPFTVDAFRYGSIEGCSAYFLTHFHADHYGGLSKQWSHGPIYCTHLTARLVRMCLYVNPSFIRPLELNEEHLIEGVRITLLDANHCPGAALIHFRLPNGQCYLHTGDFRASELMQAYPLLVKQRVNALYLDTTYCNPKYKFPSKEDVLNYVVRITRNSLKKQPKTLIVVGAYSIGKESVYLAISKALEVKIHANASRRRILQAFGWTELSERISSNAKDTLLHVLPISSLRFDNLTSYLRSHKDQYVAVLAFRPTGWTFSENVGNQLDLIKPKSRGNITIYGVPYSEHSSFTELQEFVKFLKPEKIIPTVNIGNASTREKMQSYFQEWLRNG